MADKLWDWLHEDYAGSDDAQKVELYWRYSDIMDAKDADPLGAAMALESLAVDAKNRGHAWFEMFCEHWRLQTLLNFAGQPTLALPVAVRCAVEMKKPIFRDFPQRICLHEDLITAYSEIDPHGNRELIQGALDYMEREITPDLDCALCHAGLAADFKTTLAAPDCIDAAFDFLRACDSRGDGHTAAYYRMQALAQVCQTVALFSPDYARNYLADVAFDAFENAKKSQSQEYLHEILAWLALGQLWRGKLGADTEDGEEAVPDEEEIAFGRANFEKAKVARARRGGAAKNGYFLAGEAFLRLDSKPKDALEFLDEELKEIAGSGQSFREVRRRLARLDLLRELGLETASEIAAIRLAAQNLKDASWVEDALEAPQE